MKRSFLYILFALAFALSGCMPAQTASSKPQHFTQASAVESEQASEAAIASETEQISVPAEESLFPAVSELLVEKLNIVALGDSIARGYGLADPAKQSFPAQTADSLKQHFSEVELKNYSVDGMTSAGLVSLLESGGAQELAGADAVIISIGANNILGRAYELLFFDDTDIFSLFVDYGKYLIGKGSEDAPDKLGEYLESVNKYARGDEFMAGITEGVESLKADIPKIIDAVRAQNPTAPIYFLTVYNPYRGLNLSLPYVKESFLLGELTDGYVTMLNGEITGAAEQHGYETADIYNIFKYSGRKNVNAGIDITAPSINFDPHPDLDGHTLIAGEITKLITEDLAG